MKKKKKIKLKKQAYYFLAGFIALIVLGILGMNFYNEYKYKQTDEYKIVEKGYSLEEAQLLKEKLSHEEITNLLEKDKNETIISLLKEKYFIFKNLDAYLAYYQKEEDETFSSIIAIVNVQANNKWYTKEFETDISLNEKMIVNKFYGLPQEYTPENIKNISLTYAYGVEGENQLIDYAYEKFIDLWNAAHDEGFYLMVNSSYRDYENQKEIYEYRKSVEGERKADETVGRPGHSEHQTGLVIDMTSKTEPDATSFKESLAYKWLLDHAYEYGWIERYPEGKSYLTGYSPESWHWRYVGKDVAKQIHDEAITYDEYYAYYLEN